LIIVDRIRVNRGSSVVYNSYLVSRRSSGLCKPVLIGV